MRDKDERANAPKMSRAVQDRIGKELREMYAELLRQALPENLIAPLRSTGDATIPERRLEQPVSTATTQPDTACVHPDALPEVKIA
jgi:hypothetical protein